MLSLMGQGFRWQKKNFMFYLAIDLRRVLQGVRVIGVAKRRQRIGLAIELRISEKWGRIYLN